ncbi:MAG: MerR family transcriptional regulator [Oscillospiraceae bacterium]|nr:MerR family transcriptional regulator [Oscillospiraceae bacterium]
MTIKEFAQLCNCSAQTLRYYDRIGLLKPIKVDPWSGYRYYAQNQAIDFVKIKNLQAADFTIEEIKQLLTQTDEEVYAAFDRKIAAQEQKLAKIKEIQQTYLREKSNMEALISGLSDFLLGQLSDFEGLREFGMEPEDRFRVVEHVRTYLNRWLTDPEMTEENVTLMVNDRRIQGAAQVAEAIQNFTEANLDDTILLGTEALSAEDKFRPEDFDTLWQTSGWDHVRDFLDAIPPLESDREYCLSFHLKEGNYREDISFPLFMLSAMILHKGAAEVLMGCAVERSTDGENHFALMRRK